VISNDTYEHALKRCFGVEEAAGFVTQCLTKTQLSVTRIRCDIVNNGISNPLPIEDALLVTVQLRDCPEHELWIDGRSMRTAPLSAGTTSIYDLRSDPRVNSMSPFQNMHFHVPLATLSAISESDGKGTIASFEHQPGVGLDDDIIRGLSLALQPAFDQPDQTNRLFVDHVTQAVAGHVAYLFSSLGSGGPNASRQLARRETKQIEEQLDANLNGDLTLSELGEPIGLTGREVERRFAGSTGRMPHQWLLIRRIEKAKGLLVNTNMPVTAIAVECGFSNVQHMRRVFRQLLGLLPGALRH